MPLSKHVIYLLFLLLGLNSLTFCNRGIGDFYLPQQSFLIEPTRKMYMTPVTEQEARGGKMGVQGFSFSFIDILTDPGTLEQYIQYGLKQTNYCIDPTTGRVSYKIMDQYVRENPTFSRGRGKKIYSYVIYARCITRGNENTQYYQGIERGR